MKIEFIHWIIFSIIEAVSVVYCYKKISRVNKVNIHFTLLCLGIVFSTDFTTLIHYSIRYMMFFIQPLFFYLINCNKKCNVYSYSSTRASQAVL